MSESVVPVSVTRLFEAPIERVFDAWLDPQIAGRFLFATPKGEMVHVELDPRVGGRYVLTDRRDGIDVVHTGQYVVIKRPTRLAFTFGVPTYEPGFVRVTVDLTPVGAGCELTLVNEDVPAEYAEGTAIGWGKILEALAGLL